MNFLFILPIGGMVLFGMIIWGAYILPVKALMKELENENLRLQIKLEERRNESK